MSRPLSQRQRGFVRGLAALVVAASGFVAFASPAFSAAMSGTYRFDSPRGPITATIEVRGSRLTGSIDFFGQSSATLEGSVQSESSASGALSFGRGSGAFAATLYDDTLALTLFQAGGPKPATPPMVLRRIVPAEKGPAVEEAAIAIIDQRLIGSWVYHDEFFSEEGSAARNEYLEFHADGTCLLDNGEEVTEGDGESARPGKAPKPRSGRWRTEDGVLYTRNNGSADWVRIGRYAFRDQGRSMRISYERGNRKLWTRQ